MTSPALLAAVGEVGKDFFQERSSDTLPCQADTSKLFCWDWARENIDRYGTPTVQHIELVLISVVLGFAVAFALALLAHRRRWLQPPLLAGTGVLFTIPSIAFFFLLLTDHRPRPRHGDHRPQRLHAADHLPQHDGRARQRARTRSRTPPAAWA